VVKIDYLVFAGIAFSSHSYFLFVLISFTDGLKGNIV